MDEVIIKGEKIKLMQKILIKKLHKDAKVPFMATTGSAGFDLHSMLDCDLIQGDIHMISTGLAVAIPEGFEMQIRPRSGLAKNGIIVVNSPGTIDSDYRGEIKILLSILIPHVVYQIKKGERIAQGVIQKVPSIYFEEVEELDVTKRGTGGFGHSGK
jgi:dUTP pyrophosphatase